MSLTNLVSLVEALRTMTRTTGILVMMTMNMKKTAKEIRKAKKTLRKEMMDQAEIGAVIQTRKVTRMRMEMMTQTAPEETEKESQSPETPTSPVTE